MCYDMVLQEIGNGWAKFVDSPQNPPLADATILRLAWMKIRVNHFKLGFLLREDDEIAHGLCGSNWVYTVINLALSD